ncbi:MAG: RDD family protein [bacterium]
MKKIIQKRILAFIIDYLVIALYAGILFLLVYSAIKLFNLNTNVSSVIGQLIGMISLTLPVVLYFVIMENKSKQGTIGKNIKKIKVTDVNNQTASLKYIIIRNIIKFMPWEIAHLGIHWTIYFSNEGIEQPVWIWLVLVIPQVTVVIYLLSIVIDKNNRGIYDRISHTKVIELL